MRPSDFEQLVHLLETSNCEWVSFNDDAGIFISFLCTVNGKAKEALYTFNTHGELDQVVLEEISANG